MRWRTIHEAQAIHVKTENIQHVMNEIRNDMSAIEWKMEASTQRISLIEQRIAKLEGLLSR